MLGYLNQDRFWTAHHDHTLRTLPCLDLAGRTIVIIKRRLPGAQELELIAQHVEQSPAPLLQINDPYRLPGHVRR